jgi:hypothetical protein
LQIGTGKAKEIREALIDAGAADVLDLMKGIDWTEGPGTSAAFSDMDGAAADPAQVAPSVPAAVTEMLQAQPISVTEL